MAHFWADTHIVHCKMAWIPYAVRDIFEMTKIVRIYRPHTPHSPMVNIRLDAMLVCHIRFAINIFKGAENDTLWAWVECICYMTLSANVSLHIFCAFCQLLNWIRTTEYMRSLPFQWASSSNVMVMLSPQTHCSHIYIHRSAWCMSGMFSYIFSQSQ